MTFSLFGTTLTQSGTDADLSTLAEIAGVTYVELSAGASVFRQAQLPTDMKLVIEGDLTLNASTDQLLVPHTANDFLWLEIRDGGTLKICDTLADGTTTQAYQKIALRALAQTANHWATNQGVHIDDGGTLAMDGGGLWTNSHINFNGSRAKLLVTRPSLIRLGTAANGLKNILRAAGSQAHFDIDGLILLDSTSGVETADVVKLDNYSPQFCAEGVMAYGGAAGGQLTLFGYNPLGCTIDFAAISSGSFYTVYGYADKPVTFTVHFDHATASGGGWVKIRKLLEITALDEAGDPIEGVKSYFSDVDNGGRQNKIEDVTDTLIYEQTSGADGKATHDVLLANSQLGAGEHVGRESGSRPIDYRTKTNSHDYKLDVQLIGYGYAPKRLTDVDLRGLDTVTRLSTVLLKDAAIAEPYKTVVDLYSEIRTPEQLYDRAKAHLLDAYAGETAPLLTRSGDTADLGGLDLVLDANAGPAFQFDGTAITLRSYQFTGNITTTGTVTLSNGASITGGIIDSHGDSFLTIDADWIAYASAADRDANTHALGSGDAAQTFRFNYAPNLTYYLRLSLGGETLFKHVTPTAAGQTVVELSTLAVTLQNAAKLDSLDAKVAELPDADATATAVWSHGDRRVSGVENDTALAANVKYINDMALVGSGLEGNPWGPEPSGTS